MEGSLGRVETLKRSSKCYSRRERALFGKGPSTSGTRVQNPYIGRLLLTHKEITDFPDLPFDKLEHFRILHLDKNSVSTLAVPLVLNRKTEVVLSRNNLALVFPNKLDEMKEKSKGKHIFRSLRSQFIRVQRRKLPVSANYGGTNRGVSRPLHNRLCRSSSKIVNLGELFISLDNCPRESEYFIFLPNASSHVQCLNKH